METGTGATLYSLLKDYEKNHKPNESDHSRSLLGDLITLLWNKALDHYPWISLVVLLIALVWVKPLLKWMWKIPAGIGRVLEKPSARRNTPKASPGLSAGVQ